MCYRGFFNYLLNPPDPPSTHVWAVLYTLVGLGPLFVMLNVADPRAPSCLNSRLLGYVTIGYVEPSSHYLGNWKDLQT